MKKFLLIIPVLLLTGCVSIVDYDEDRDKVIEDCINAGGTAYVENYHDSRLRPKVHCKFDNEENIND